jgi:hypothetical protein
MMVESVSAGSNAFKQFEDEGPAKIDWPKNSVVSEVFQIDEALANSREEESFVSASQGATMSRTTFFNFNLKLANVVIPAILSQLVCMAMETIGIAFIGNLND